MTSEDRVDSEKHCIGCSQASAVAAAKALRKAVAVCVITLDEFGRVASEALERLGKINLNPSNQTPGKSYDEFIPKPIGRRRRR